MDIKASRTSLTSDQDRRCQRITHSSKPAFRNRASILIMPRERILEGCSSLPRTCFVHSEGKRQTYIMRHKHTSRCSGGGRARLNKSKTGRSSNPWLFSFDVIGVGRRRVSFRTMYIMTSRNPRGSPRYDDIFASSTSWACVLLYRESGCELVRQAHICQGSPRSRLI
jgi:hypothetical protein